MPHGARQPAARPALVSSVGIFILTLPAWLYVACRGQGGGRLQLGFLRKRGARWCGLGQVAVVKKWLGLKQQLLPEQTDGLLGLSPSDWKARAAIYKARERREEKG